MDTVTLTAAQATRRADLQVKYQAGALSEDEYIEYCQLVRDLDEASARELYRSAYLPRIHRDRPLAD